MVYKIIILYPLIVWFIGLLVFVFSLMLATIFLKVLCIDLNLIELVNSHIEFLNIVWIRVSFISTLVICMGLDFKRIIRLTDKFKRER